MCRSQEKIGNSGEHDTDVGVVDNDMEDGVLDHAAEDEEDDDFDAIVNKNYLEYQKAQRKKKAAIWKQAKMAAAHGTKSVYQGEGSKY